MEEKIKNIWEHMLTLGKCSLAAANTRASFFIMDNKMATELAVLQAAHAAEIFIKARIAQEHPLLIFEQIPKRSSTNLLTLEDLYKRGKTIQWSDLPDRLWAASGMELPNIELFKEFGHLRNSIQHFYAPYSADKIKFMVMNFIYNVIDPFINICWNEYAIDYSEEESEFFYLACIEYLICNEISFSVSPESINYLEDWKIELENSNEQYCNEINKKIEIASNS